MKIVPIPASNVPLCQYVAVIFILKSKLYLYIWVEQGLVFYWVIDQNRMHTYKVNSQLDLFMAFLYTERSHLPSLNFDSHVRNVFWQTIIYRTISESYIQKHKILILVPPCSKWKWHIPLFKNVKPSDVLVLYVQEVELPVVYNNLPHKMVHYFLDIQYLCSYLNTVFKPGSVFLYPPDPDPGIFSSSF